MTTGLLQGGAISQAKGAFSNWWTTLTTVQANEGEQATRIADEGGPECEETVQNLANESTAEIESPKILPPQSQANESLVAE